MTSGKVDVHNGIVVNPSFVNGSFYHVYNRGVEKRKTFMDRRDHLRFLETLDFYRKSPVPMKLSDFRRGEIKLKKIENQEELVRIFCYCLMPNHFHLLVQQSADGGISEFMRKLSDSYTRYFNTKHKRIGSLFQGAFKAKLVETEEYLLHLSKYIHRNSFPLEEWERKVYPYSSYQYYLSGGAPLFYDTSFISSFFSKTNPNLTYRAFVEETEIDAPVLFDMLIDAED